MTNDEVKAKLVERLLFIQKEIESRKKDLGDPIHHHHYLGYLEASDGMFGERKFLETLIDKIGDTNADD